MYKKLDEATIYNLLETGIHEFAEHGFDQANVNRIAKDAGLSVGVIYKYYDGKEGFFLACVRHSLKLLDEAMADAMSDEDDFMGNVRRVLFFLIENARKHPDYYLLYHEITAGGCKKFATTLAGEIETLSSNVYSNLIERARDAGNVRADMDCHAFAFFFDNLLMMLQFSYCCDYYKERMRIYCGGKIPADDHVVEEMLKFTYGALKVKNIKETP